MSIDWTPSNIRTLRNTIKLTVEELASVVGLTAQQLVEVENGTRFLSMHALARISNLYQDHLHRVVFSAKEAKGAHGLEFLMCVTKKCPLSSGASTTGEEGQTATGYFDLLMVVVDDTPIKEAIENCARQYGIEVLSVERLPKEGPFQKRF